MQQIINFFQESVVELRQVRWPTRQQAVRLSIIVIAFTLACTLVLGAVDFGLSRLLRELLVFAD